MKHPTFQCTKDGAGEFCAPRSLFRGGEGAWLHYRDVWVTYGAIKWPQVTVFDLNAPGRNPKPRAAAGG
jgi:hypothetical protein